LLASRRCFGASIAVVSAVLVLSSEAAAGARQWHGGPVGGFAGLMGTDIALGGSVSGQINYGISDAFRFGATLDVPLGARISTGVVSSWPGVALGIAYSLDVGTVVPWLALEARAHAVFANGSAPTWLIGGGGRFGVDWLPRRYLGLTFQGTYSACFFEGGLAHMFGVSIGPRWTLDV
jgi:hypothetical protein